MVEKNKIDNEKLINSSFNFLSHTPKIIGKMIDGKGKVNSHLNRVGFDYKCTAFSASILTLFLVSKYSWHTIENILDQTIERLLRTWEIDFNNIKKKIRAQNNDLVNFAIEIVNDRSKDSHLEKYLEPLLLPDNLEPKFDDKIEYVQNLYDEFLTIIKTYLDKDTSKFDNFENIFNDLDSLFIKNIFKEGVNYVDIKNHYSKYLFIVFKQAYN